MRYFLLLLLAFQLSLPACKNRSKEYIDYKVIHPINEDSTVNMIVEIPTGTTAKFEMNKVSYALEMDSINNQPRFIDYLGYPGNYGMIPQTILPKNMGGDGDPLDIILLGPTVPRGSVQKVKIIGVLELLDNGEQDDKLIAILPESNWSKLKDVSDLDLFYPGSKVILETFFQNYKGSGQMEIKGWSGKAKALDILQKSISSESKQ
jgi:inorganic pyrophosphatase